MSTSAPDALGDAFVDAPVRAVHPHYVAALVAATGLDPGPTTDASDALLAEAETHAARVLASCESHDLPEIQVWRQAFLGFGVKHREARSSVESLIRRASSGLPRIDRLTDTYNAISVLHLVPVGGEDLAGYQGAPRLVISNGDEPFDTIADGEQVVQFASVGEVVWRDDAGVTCRRWNWRQCLRTRLTTSTSDALFIMDGLGSEAVRRTEAAAIDLVSRLQIESSAATFHIRMLTA